MATHDLISCPRCEQPFECKPGNITECQCFGLRFTEEEKEYIQATGSDCLCRNCLEALRLECRYEATRQRLIRMREIMQRT